MGITRKRKLSLHDISRCHPIMKGSKIIKGTRKSHQCLPNSVYHEISTTAHLSKKALFQSLGCNEGEEHCLLDKAPIDESIKKTLRHQYLRPRRPKGWDADPDMWLDNYNIMHVMKQYEEAIPSFTFLGVFPIDFSAPDPYQKSGEKHCLHKEICELNLIHEYHKGKRGIGMVFNLDPHYKGGSHWVALYINIMNIKKPFVCYFDSYGYDTPPLIARLMRSFKLQIKNCHLGRNARRFQYGNSECGMFSIYFIICMIHGIPFKQFCKDSVSDEFMLQLRKVLFSK
jgi:hypothetical protein